MDVPVWKVGLSAWICVMLAACGAPAANQQPLTAPTAPVQATPQPAPTVLEAAPQAAVTHGGPVRDHVSLIDNLRAKGVEVEPGDTVRQPFLQAQGWLLQLRGGPLTQPATIQSYWYDDTELGKDSLAVAAADAEQIQQGTGTNTVSWIAPPHFFRKERAFVIYVGSDSSVLALLTELMGPPFAGQ